MAKSKTSEVIKLPRVRLSFAELFKAKAFAEGQEAYFKATFLLDPSNAEHAKVLGKLKASVESLTAEAFNGEKLPADRICIANGNTKKYDGYAGMIAVSSSNKVRPVVVNRARQPVAEGDAECPYSGCYVNASITLWTQNNKFGKRINANLRGVQFVDDGEAFGIAPVDADEEFEMLEDAAPEAAASYDFG
jgi:hypothetical protein